MIDQANILGRRLPKPVKVFSAKLLRRYFSWRGRYFSWRGYQLSGMLEGYRLRGYYYKAFQKGTYETEVCNILTKLIQPGWYCADVGAFLGYFSLLMAKQSGAGGIVYAFEPNSKTASLLIENVRINNLHDVVVVENVAVADVSEENIHLFFGQRSDPSETTIIHHLANSKYLQKIDAISLDDYFSTIPRIDLVKIDVEGAEDAVICGMSDILSHKRPWLLIEYHSDETWLNRDNLYQYDYELYDVKNRVWISRDHNSRIYHCLAGPSEQFHMIGRD